MSEARLSEDLQLSALPADSCHRKEELSKQRRSRQLRERQVVLTKHKCERNILMYSDCRLLRPFTSATEGFSVSERADIYSDVICP